MQDVVMAAVQQNLGPVILPIFWDESHRGKTISFDE
jgi:hypothetical protein